MDNNYDENFIIMQAAIEFNKKWPNEKMMKLTK